TVRAARRADPADHGQPAARTVERRPQGGAVHHPRSGRGDRARRPRRHHGGGAALDHHRRLARAVETAARHLRRPPAARIPRPAPRDLEQAEGRGLARLSAILSRGGDGMSRASLLLAQLVVAAVLIAAWHVATTVPFGG